MSVDAIIEKWDNYIEQHENYKRKLWGQKPLVATVIKSGKKEFYRSTSEVGRILGLQKISNIHKVLEGQIKTVYGRYWRFATAEEVENDTVC